MDIEIVFRIAIALILALFAVIRIYYARLAIESGGNFFRPRRDVRQTLFGILFFSSIVLIGVYVVAPEQLGWATLRLPVGWRWIGIGLGLLSLLLLLWSHQALGGNLSAPGVMKENQSLVTTGPYKWVRHPMYTAMFLIGFSYLLTSANWLIGAVWIVWIVGTVATMLGDEEAAMIGMFGERYRAYMQRTGNFFPRIF